ncbi:glutamate racemase [Brumimicrobium salinarum]|uniref:Glutamate racemase n=1 Tax=Brumimicrobium salinarum TaxID=2058658 RepID=A0A2I0R3I6_9FLAO|nr:glutamate racemase [Brumimicrobium salinarum]PKR81138.1 glutamate racemase [Brumimicrobium salinarum]
MNKYAPIGFFDSGFGGLTVLKEVRSLLPDYDYLYLGDNDRAPYGNKSSKEVYEYTWECVQNLFKKGCDLVILACNTASAKALRKIQQNDLKNFPGKRVLGVIRPSAEIVGDYSITKKLIILGTQGTIDSSTYLEEFAHISPEIDVWQQACPEWVPLIEAQKYSTEEGKQQIVKDVERALKSLPSGDVILLGCTHYPIIQDIIEEQVPTNVKVISQGSIVAISLMSYLERHGWMKTKLSKGSTIEYLTTGEKDQFETHASMILEEKIKAKNIIL